MIIPAGTQKYDAARHFEYENGFFLTCPNNRIGKILAHYELYRKILHLPGAIVECGVFKGASLIRFSTFRDILEAPGSRKIIGFDVFGKFPDTEKSEDQALLNAFIKEAGIQGIASDVLQEVFSRKQISNVELVAGDILETVPEYINNHNELRIALLHIDTDIFEPAETALKYLFPLVCSQGIVLFDNYGVFPGETKAVDAFLAKNPVNLRKLSLAHAPVYLVKE